MAFSFNGSSQWLSLVYPGVSAGSDRTIAFWLRTTANNVRQFPFACGGDVANGRLAIEFGDSGAAFGLNIYSTGYTGSTVPVVDTWYHLAITYTGNTLKLYVNGVEEVSQSVTLNTATTNFEIGRFYGASLYLSGRIAEFAKWQVGLDAGAVLGLAKGFSPAAVRNDSLEFYAPLVRELVDVRGGASITNNGSASNVVHPRMYY